MVEPFLYGLFLPVGINRKPWFANQVPAFGQNPDSGVVQVENLSIDHKAFRIFESDPMGNKLRD
jgi:hypothetical protein